MDEVISVTIDGIEYWQPECHCQGGAHTCYLRPMPQAIKLNTKGLRKVFGSQANIATSRKLAKNQPNKLSKGEADE